MCKRTLARTASALLVTAALVAGTPALAAPHHPTSSGASAVPTLLGWWSDLAASLGHLAGFGNPGGADDPAGLFDQNGATVDPDGDAVTTDGPDVGAENGPYVDPNG